MASQENRTDLRPASPPNFPAFSQPLPSPDTPSLENNGYATVSPRSSSLLTLTLSSVIAAGVQFGWALQLSLLTPFTEQGPARALLADLAGAEQRDMANAIFCLWMAVGNIVGFSTGASGKWHKVFPRVITLACSEACGDLKAVFLVAVVFLLVCTSITVFFAKEVPLVSKSKRMEDASPLLSTEPEKLVELQGVRLSTEMDHRTHSGRVEFQHTADHEEEGESAGAGPGAVLVNLLTSIRHLPPQMKSVLMVMALCWMSWFPFFLYDTDWMGKEVFHGDPKTNKDPYYEGVKKGAFGLLLNSAVLAIGSFFIDPLCRRIGPKLVWSISNFMIFFGLASTPFISALANPKEETATYANWAKIAAVVVFAMLGLPLAVTYSVPYSITAELTSDSGGGQGLAMGVLNLAVVVPQMIVALGAGPLDGLFGESNEPAFGFAALFACAAGVVAWTKLPELANGGYRSAGGGHGFG